MTKSPCASEASPSRAALYCARLDSAAETLHQKADRMPGGEKAARAAHTAADALSSTAEYIREHDVKSMVADMQDVVRRNPGPALLVAAAVGFLFARTFSRD